MKSTLEITLPLMAYQGPSQKYAGTCLCIASNIMGWPLAFYGWLRVKVEQLDTS